MGGVRYVLCHCYTRRVQKSSPRSQAVAGAEQPPGATPVYVGPLRFPPNEGLDHAGAQKVAVGLADTDLCTLYLRYFL